jgi:hypothetical protein
LVGFAGSFSLQKQSLQLPCFERAAESFSAGERSKHMTARLSTKKNQKPSRRHEHTAATMFIPAAVLVIAGLFLVARHDTL